MGAICLSRGGPGVDLDQAAAENREFLSTRTSERQEMVVLNDRLAAYIEKASAFTKKLVCPRCTISQTITLAALYNIANVSDATLFKLFITIIDVIDYKITKMQYNLIVLLMLLKTSLIFRGIFDSICLIWPRLNASRALAVWKCHCWLPR